MNMNVNPQDAVRQAQEAIKKAMGTPVMPDGDMLAKATFNQSSTATSGITFYDLELGAKLLYPVLTPLRNIIPRVGGGRGIQANWRAITGVNTTNVRAGVSEGNRGGVIAVSTADYIAAFRGIGLEDSVTFEADYAAEGFDDVKALSVSSGLQALMLQEEPMILGGNGTAVALGTTGTPTVADVTTGGSLLANTAYSVICVALTLEGYINGSVSGGIQSLITRVNADGSTDQFGGGAAQKSAAGTVTTANDGLTTHSLTVSVANVVGALGYAWFWGTSGSEVLGAITTTRNTTLTANATGTQTAASLPSADWSKDALTFDGLLYQAFKTGSNSYVSYLGSTLTSDAAGGIVEIDAALKDRWDNYRLTPDTIWVNSQQALDISKKILAGNSSAAQRFVFQTAQDAIGGGVMVRTYLNRFSMGGGLTLDIKIHPNMPPGCILMTASRIPYPMSGVGNVMQIKTRREYYQIAWPLRTRKYEYGVYADEVLQHYFPPSMCVIYGIVAG